MPSSLPWGGSPQPKWYDQNNDNEPSTNMGQLEMSTNQRNIPTRDIYRADTHPPRSGNTISRNHDSCAMPRTVEGDTVSHVYPQFSSWSPMRGCHYPRKGGMKGERKCGTTAIKEEETNEAWDEKIE
ncbi:hypothetical protein AB3S75_019828 [Citrus x aurantiifolia]